MNVEMDGVAWEFETEGGAEGWVARNQLTPLVVNRGAMSARSTGNDPYLGSPVFTLDGDKYPIHEVRMSVTSGSTAKIYFVTSTKAEFDEAKSIQFEIIPDGQLHTYRLGLSGIANWYGTITQIRLDPCEAEASMLIDFIRILTP